MKKQKKWKRRIYKGKCLKMGYGSKAEANRIASKILHNPDSTVEFLGSYKCPNCKMWHLSKSIQNKQKMVYV